MTRVVVDTNTTVSAFLWGGTPRQLFNLAIEGGITLLSSDAMVQELENTLNKPKLEKYVKLSGKTPSELVADFVKLVTLVEPAEIPADAVRDPDDVKVLATAVSGKATHIVSGDDDLLSLNVYAGIPIMKVRDFIERIKPDDET